VADVVAEVTMACRAQGTSDAAGWAKAIHAHDPARENIAEEEPCGDCLCDSSSILAEPKAETRYTMLKLCRKNDTVRSSPSPPGPEAVRAPCRDDANIARALTPGCKGGGTEMLKGVQMAIDEPIDKERLRIVVMLTDGYIGNEAEIIEHVGKHCGDQIRFWCVGIGSSPNMFLVDGVAKQGGGMGKKLNLPDDASRSPRDHDPHPAGPACQAVDRCRAS
jgi:hypothetical protein